MALDLALTTYQLLSALDGLTPEIQSRRRRLDDAIDRALAVPAGGAAFRTAAVGRRPYITARTGPEGLLGSQPPPEVPQDWTALSVDGSHIDVDRHLPLRCHLDQPGRLRHHLRSEPWLPTVQRADPGRGRRRPVPPFSRRRARRNPDRRPVAGRAAHGAGGGAPGRRRRKPAR